MAPKGHIATDDLPARWGLLECTGKRGELRRKSRCQRSLAGLMFEMNLLLVSLRRVEIRIEPQTITEFLKWKNRMQDYNGGALPEGITPPEREPNCFLQPSTEN